MFKKISLKCSGNSQFYISFWTTTNILNNRFYSIFYGSLHLWQLRFFYNYTQKSDPLLFLQWLHTEQLIDRARAIDIFLFSWRICFASKSMRLCILCEGCACTSSFYFEALAHTFSFSFRVKLLYLMHTAHTSLWERKWT